MYREVIYKNNDLTASYLSIKSAEILKHNFSVHLGFLICAVNYIEILNINAISMETHWLLSFINESDLHFM